MVEAGKMRLIEKGPGENGEICLFETVTRHKFSVVNPTLSRDQEAALIDVLREILKDEETTIDRE
jgi:hypothetical protein